MPARHARGRVSSSAKQISTALWLVEPAETVELNHAAVFDAEPSRPMLALSTSPMLVVPAAGDLFEQARKECLGQYPVALQPKRFAISDYQRKPRRSLLKPHRTLPRHRHPARNCPGNCLTAIKYICALVSFMGPRARPVWCVNVPRNRVFQAARRACAGYRTR